MTAPNLMNNWKSLLRIPAWLILLGPAPVVFGNTASTVRASSALLFEQTGQGRFLSRSQDFGILLDHDAVMFMAAQAGRWSGIKARFEGANPLARAEGEGARTAISRIRPGDSSPQVTAAWQQVRYRDIYKGVDAVFHSDGNTLEYDFVVRPHADPASICLNFGSSGVQLNKAGDLVSSLPPGVVLEKKPVAWQFVAGVKHPVDAGFRLENSIVRLEIGPYDSSRELTIDPTLVYATNVQGSIPVTPPDEAYGVAADANGSAYITGIVRSWNFPVTADAYDTSCGTDGKCNGTTYKSSDAYVAKLSPDGTQIVYATYVGGSGFDYGKFIEVDGQGNAYVAGYTESADFPVSSGAYQKYSPAAHSFILKLDPTGSRMLYSTFLPGTLVGMAADASALCFLIVDPPEKLDTTSGALSAPLHSSYLGRLNSLGTALDYATYISLRTAATVRPLTMNSAGVALVVGTSVVPQFPTTSGVLQPNHLNTSGGGGVVCSLDTTNKRVIFSTYLSGTAGSDLRSGGIDANGNAYVAGRTDSTDFPGLPPGSVYFLAKLAPDGSALLWEVGDRSLSFNLAVTDPDGNTAAFAAELNGYSDASSEIRLYDSGGQKIAAAPIIATTKPDHAWLAMDAKQRAYLVSYSIAWPHLPGSSLGAADIMCLDLVKGHMQAPSEVDSRGPLVITGAGYTLPFHYKVTASAPWVVISSPEGVSNSSLPSLDASSPDASSRSNPYPFIDFQTESLAPGIHTATLTVTAEGVDNSPVSIRVRTLVPTKGYSIPGSIYTVCDGTVACGARLLLPAAAQLSSTDPWIHFTYDETQSGWAAYFDIAQLTGGYHSATIDVVLPPGEPRGPWHVNVGLFLALKTLNLSTDPVQFNVLPNDTSKRTAHIPIPFTAQFTAFPFSATVDNASWLQAAPESSPEKGLRLTADPAGLAAGTYRASVTVSMPATPNRSAQVPVTMVIGDAPLTVEPASIVFDPNLEADTLTVSIDGSPRGDYTAYTEAPCSVSPSAGALPAVLHIHYDNSLATSVRGVCYIEVARPDKRFVSVPITPVPHFLRPSISPGGIVNSATFQPGPVAPGSLISIFGSDLAHPGEVAPALSIARSHTTINSGEIPVFYLSPNQVNAQIPYEWYFNTQAARTIDVLNDSSSLPAPITVQPTAPYIFIREGNRAVAQNADFSLNGPADPASSGGFVTVYLTGQGTVTPPIPTGMAAPADPLSLVNAPVTAKVDGLPATVLFAGMTPGFVGLCQVNLKLPALPRGDHKLVINVGLGDSNSALISTQ